MVVHTHTYIHIYTPSQDITVFLHPQDPVAPGVKGHVCDGSLGHDGEGPHHSNQVTTPHGQVVKEVLSTKHQKALGH